MISRLIRAKSNFSYLLVCLISLACFMLGYIIQYSKYINVNESVKQEIYFLRHIKLIQRDTIDKQKILIDIYLRERDQERYNKAEELKSEPPDLRVGI